MTTTRHELIDKYAPAEYNVMFKLLFIIVTIGVLSWYVGFILENLLVMLFGIGIVQIGFFGVIIIKQNYLRYNVVFSEAERELLKQSTTKER